MSKAKIAITLEEETLEKVDRLIKLHVFPNRSRVIQEAVEEKLTQLEKNRLTAECAKLDPAFERALAEEGLSEDWLHGRNTLTYFFDSAVKLSGFYQ